VIQDGSSFALRKEPRDVFPGRFTTVEPAAVELHVYRGFSDEVSSVQLAPDKEAVRRLLPAASTLKDRLLLADRGYPAWTASRRSTRKAARSSFVSRGRTRRVAVCAGHIIDDIVATPIACVSTASAFLDGMTFLLANARRSNHTSGRLRSGCVSSEFVVSDRL
jgi:hypothetical protein